MPDDMNEEVLLRIDRIRATADELERLSALSEQFCDVCGEDLNDGRDVIAYHRDCERRRT